MRRIFLSGAALAALLVSSSTAAQELARPQLWVVRDVRLEDRPDAPRQSLVLRAGRVERLLPEGAEMPPGARFVEGKGMLVVPAFIDAYSFLGTATPDPKVDRDLPPNTQADVSIDMREANRKGVQPAFRSADALELAADKVKGWREAGFAAVLSAPHGQILAGSSALVLTREAAARDAILAPDVFVHAAFRASGAGYPSTLMGYTAQLRQFFLDARYVEMLAARASAGRAGPRPPFDRDLEAGRAILEERERIACEADTAKDIERWMRLSGELGFDIAIVGGREAWKLADELATRRIPVILTLDWGEELTDPHAKDPKPKAEPPAPDAAPPEAAAAESEPPAASAPDAAKPPEVDPKKAWEYEEPLAVREERRREWERGRDCAQVLAVAGVPFAFGTAGGSPSELLKKVRTLVERGLASDVALAALSRSAAAILGARDLGLLEPGQSASLALWTAPPLAKEGKVSWLFVEGFPFEFELDQKPALEGKPDEGVDASGEWTFEFPESQQTPVATLTLSMTPEGEVSGALKSKSPRDQSDVSYEVTGKVAGKEMALSGTMSTGETSTEISFRGTLSGTNFEGERTSKSPRGERTTKVVGTKKPKEQGR